MAEPAEIFISHADEDSTWAHTFGEILRQAGADVWPSEQRRGDSARELESERQLRARPIFILVLSSPAVSERRVHLELDMATRLQKWNPERVSLLVPAAPTEMPHSWDGLLQVSGLEDSGWSAAEAARRVIQSLGIAPAEASAAAPPPVETAIEANTRGNGLYAEQRYGEALVAYERATNLEPGNALYWKGRANALFGLRRNAEALTTYERVLALDPQLAVAWNSLGVTLEKLNRNKEALTAYERTLSLEPGYALAWNNMGYLLWKLNRPEDALAAIEKALGLDPQDADTWYSKAMVLEDLKQYENALAAVQRALTLNPDLQFAGAVDFKIMLLSQLGRAAEA
jgi:tetratricopeptide (TPR) repeat protein